MTLSQEHIRYLRLLGFDDLPGGLDGLRLLVLRQLCRIPFENVSKLILFGREGRGRVTPLSEYLDGIERFDLGGTCYTANPYFAQLLAACGYEVDLLGASMSAPNVHTCIRVRVDGIAYHVDVGYASPFRSPMRIDRFPLGVNEGVHSYKLGRSEESDEVTVDVYSGTDRVHGYRAHNTPRALKFFEQTILDSYLPGKTFMLCLRVARFFERGSVQLRDRMLTVIEDGGYSSRELTNISELEEAMASVLQMPRCPAREAVSALEEITGEPFFKRG